jgi:ABC-type sugar transport system ATPase subunit
MQGKGAVVRFERIDKWFGSTHALADVSLEVEGGEVHGLVGQNGAGKSTLGKVLGGLYQPDSGLLHVLGVSVAGWVPRRALAAGVAMIQQELSLVPHLTVAENVFLGVETNRFGMLHNDLRSRYSDLEARVGFGIDPDVEVDTLRIADQQKVEILRALARDARIIVMDEPASSLTADETDKLHGVISALQAQGRTIIYITHFLKAVLAHSDHVSVMRDGRLVRTSTTSQETERSLVEAMLGKPLDLTFPRLPPAPEAASAPVLELRNIISGTAVKGVSLQVRPGEIVGLAGLVGSGRSEIVRTIYGADHLDEGEVIVSGRVYPSPSPRESIGRKVHLIPEDRRHQGLVMSQSISRNISLPHPARVGRMGTVTPGAERRLADQTIARLGIKPPRPNLDVVALSGGNQQKVLFGKWMIGSPLVVLLDEPTRGVDIGAKRQIYEFVVQLAEARAGVLFISSELEEVMGLCHRVLLVKQGQIVREVDPRTTSIDEVLFSLFGLERGAGSPQQPPGHSHERLQ